MTELLKNTKLNLEYEITEKEDTYTVLLKEGSKSLNHPTKTWLSKNEMD